MAAGTVTDIVRATEAADGYRAEYVEHLQIMRIPGAEVEHSTISGFVFGSFVMSLRQPGWRLANALKRPGTVCLVATPVGGDTFVGWLAARPAENRIVCAFTKAAYRASPEQRAGAENNADAFRIASTLAIAAGIDFSKPVLSSFWSRPARAIAGKSGNPYGLRYAPEGK